MQKQEKHVLNFHEVDKGDIPLVGGKGANLGEMIKVGIPVPNGFIVTAKAYYDFINSTTLRNQIEKELKGLDVNKTNQLERKARKIQKSIMNAMMPRQIRTEIIEAYSRLSGFNKALVAVRSSATAEDLPDASFAGQQSTYLNIKGDNNVVESVKMCWASLFEPRAIFYRENKGYDHMSVGVAVPVQKMVQSEVAGVMFTINPINNDEKFISIEAVLGLGETIVSGAVTPDQYLVNKRSLNVIEKHISQQEWMLVRRGRGAAPDKSNIKVKISPSWQRKQKLSDKHVEHLAEVGKLIEKHYGVPQDIEWALEKGKIWIVQSRPVTTLKLDDNWKETPTMESLRTKIESESKAAEKGSKNTKTSDVPVKQTMAEINVSIDEIRKELKKLNLVVRGTAASPGIISGKVNVIKDVSEMGKVKTGDILVTLMTTPSWVPVMRKASAIITDQGGSTCHAAIVSRELGIPCVVGTQIATRILKSGETVTVDGEEGKVFEGELKFDKSKKGASNDLRDSILAESQAHHTSKNSAGMENYVPLKTATKVYVNLAEPSRAEEIARRDIDGVGLLRAEFMMADIGMHPRYAIDNGKRKDYIDKLTEGLATFCQAFGERPVIYRATDFKTNEFKALKGGAKYEFEESNPMIGYRGAFRYITDPKVIEMELEAIKRVRNKMGHKNLWLMIPFVRTVDEMVQVKHMVNNAGLRRSASFKLFMMVEIPANVILIEDFLAVGVDGVSIGTNDLTQLTLGLDRDNPKVQPEFDERNPAVLWSLEKVVKAAHKAGVMCSVCGQAPSVYPEITKALVEYGVTSVSINPDMIEQTRTLISELENELISKRRRS
ncbi:phosphoenolpyruvate synthase [Candidatus Dojkabacteria bacterium]|uniref:Phosphoenolpyruvate synthase n=1 Tax=Candidatus Dojkabacteria bacterium TaxID=2099670 RepID=A0A955L375_9BACT|nr:phosphoenolpyruvate synthase [Candidatus Dojkabacteria bacterium]